MIKGFTAGNFDVIHPGYIKLFKECFENCNHFTILLHSDPSIERPSKLKPILELDERIELLESIKYISEINSNNKSVTVISRKTEKSLPLSILEGIKNSRFNNVMWLDADGSMTVKAIKKIVDAYDRQGENKS